MFTKSYRVKSWNHKDRITQIIISVRSLKQLRNIFWRNSSFNFQHQNCQIFRLKTRLFISNWCVRLEKNNIVLQNQLCFRSLQFWAVLVGLFHDFIVKNLLKFSFGNFSINALECSERIPKKLVTLSDHIEFADWV